MELVAVFVTMLIETLQESSCKR